MLGHSYHLPKHWEWFSAAWIVPEHDQCYLQQYLQHYWQDLLTFHFWQESTMILCLTVTYSSTVNLLWRACSACLGLIFPLSPHLLWNIYTAAVFVLCYVLKCWANWYCPYLVLKYMHWIIFSQIPVVVTPNIDFINRATSQKVW